MRPMDDPGFKADYADLKRRNALESQLAAVEAKIRSAAGPQKEKLLVSREAIRSEIAELSRRLPV